MDNIYMVSSFSSVILTATSYMSVIMRNNNGEIIIPLLNCISLRPKSISMFKEKNSKKKSAIVMPHNSFVLWRLNNLFISNLPRQVIINLEERNIRIIVESE